MKNYDVIIIGGGPAGYTAALYIARTGFNTVVIEKMYPGGQMIQTDNIDNYPGFEEGIDGISLGSKIKEQAHRYGAITIDGEVLQVQLKGERKKVKVNDDIILGKCVVIATGAKHRHLGLKGEDKLIGKGVHYCATCDGMFYKDKTVVVVGGGNTAINDAIVLSRFCKKVILVHRRDSLRATKIYHTQLKSIPNIEIMLSAKVKELVGSDKLESVYIENIVNDTVMEIKCDGIFVSIGMEPETKLFQKEIDLDNEGYIIANESTTTNVEGVYAIGDVRTKKVRQIITAAADGAIVASYVEEYLLK